MKYYVLLIATLFLFGACSDKENDTPPINVYEIRNIGELSTTEYTVGKIIKLDDQAEDYEWYEYDKYGDRKILISVKAKVKAGIDLSQINEDDIKIDGNTIEITLPPANITSFSIDPKAVETEMESVTGFRPLFTQEEKNDFLKQGEEAIKRDLAETGILDDANDNAEAFIEEFYKQMGYEKVIVKRSPTR